MRWLLLLSLVGVTLMPGRGDGDWNDDDLPYTYSTNRVSGDLVSDQSLPIRLMDPTTGAGLFTTNSDPNVVGVDPLTGEDAPTGTDVGFGAAVRRYIQTGVLNGDFALPPPDITQAISDANPLPYWTWTPPADGSQEAFLVEDGAYASGHALSITGTSAGDPGILSQMVPVPMSQGQQYRVLLSSWCSSTGGGGNFHLRYQFYEADGTTAIGSAVSAVTGSSIETKLDAGLVPTTAAYIKVDIVMDWSVIGSPVVGEVRAAFLPAEATLGLGSTTAASGAITTTETVVKSVTVPAGTFVVGSVYRISAWATVTSSAANVVTIRVRVGPTTLTGAIVESINPTATTTASNHSVKFDAMFTVRSVGATGTVTGAMSMLGNSTQPFAVSYRTDVDTGTTTIDTTVANLVELTAVTAAGTTSINFRQAVIECVMAS